MDSALQLLRERGPQGVTMEAVALRSGRAKTTIYRRYRNRYELLRASLSFVEGIPEPPPGLSLRERLHFLLEQFRHGLEEVVGLRVLAALLSGDEDDPEFSRAFRESVLNPRVEVLLTALEQGIDEGELRPGIDCPTVVSMLAGSFIALSATQGTVPPDWTDTVLDALWPALT
ncbi:TetR/AcrR family transcriptional regulator [Streptomyces xiaopingdaonensis]|uniref:TetR/AcrR family transcriptional regulator n=1 Tax=Streptomyces xiaopingdaonensis TaxID=1565415 RepID=UPI0003631872|nr:TetR/AcrR family transcriptional regulator [Streptomyces xiaopingdaonensis]